MHGHFRTRLIWGALFLSLWLAAPGGATARVFDPATFTLANGMQVVVIENHCAPVVSHMVWYRVGAADEPAGKSGLAHVLEHLMFKGTSRFPDGVFSDIVARNGGEENAFTSWDYTAYYQNVAADRLALVMEMEADRMTGLVLSDAVIEPELQVILEERRQRTENNPGARLAEQSTRAFYRNHPYGTPIIGWAHEIEQLSRADILDFYRQWYAPNNAVLVIAGDVSLDAVRPLAAKFYGVIPSHPVPARFRPQEPPHEGESRLILRDDRVRQRSWSRRFWVAGLTAATARDYYALQVLDQILGGNSTSVLYKSLVRERGLAVAAGSRFNTSLRDSSTFSLYASPKPDTTIDQIEAAMADTMAEFLAHPIDEAMVARAKQQLIAAAVLARDGYSTGARILGQALTTDRTIDAVESWPDHIAAVTAAEVRAAASAVLRHDSALTSVLLPKSVEAKP